MLISMASSVPMSVVPAMTPAVSRGALPKVATAGSSIVFDEESFYRMLQSFSKHDTVRLRAEVFVQWQYQLQLSLDAYCLTGFV